MDFTVADFHDQTLKVGDRVRISDWQEQELTEAQATGTILNITEPEGDADAQGRPIAINPRVNVRFDAAIGGGNTIEDFGTYWSGRYPDEDAPFICEELDLLTKED